MEPAIILDDEKQEDLRRLGLRPYDRALAGWDVEALAVDFVGLEPPLPRLEDLDDIPW